MDLFIADVCNHFAINIHHAVSLIARINDMSKVQKAIIYVLW